MKKIVVMMAVIGTLILSTVQAQDSTARTEFNKMLSAYFDMKNALATDNVNLAGTSAKSLLTSLKTFPIKKLPVVQHADWKAQTAEIKKFTEPIVFEKELKAQRKSFEGVSYAMIKLVKALNLNNNDVFVQYCPMAKKSWLNEDEEVQNPFYGSKMYDCGEVTSTITKK
jgi:hypothetical protein